MQARCILCVLLASMVYAWLVKADEQNKCSLKDTAVACDEVAQAKQSEVLIKSTAIKPAVKENKTKPEDAEKNAENKANPSAQDKLYSKKLDEAYTQVKTMQANFEQSYSSGLKEEHAKGIVYISRPGKMKWEYELPKGKFFLADGEYLRLFDPTFLQVMQSKQSSPDQAPIGLALLFGNKKASSLFNIEVLKDNKTTVILKLTPKESVPNVEEVHMTLKKGKVYTIEQTKVLDVFGGENVMKFTEVKNNIQLNASTFEFKKPKNVKVVSTDEMTF